MADRDRVEVPRIERLTQVGVEPIEIWDLLIGDGKILWERQDDPLVVAAAIAQLRAGTAVSRSSGPVTAATGIERVFLTGGRLADEHLTQALTSELGRLGMAATCSSDAVFGAAAAAAEVFPDSLIIDVGQTQVKVVSHAGQTTWPRDVAVLPVAEVDASDRVFRIDEQREEFVDMVRCAIDALHDRAGGCSDGVVLALPCTLEPDGAGGIGLGASSYVGMAGDHQRLRDLVALVPRASWRVLNDAELAVFAARRVQSIEPAAFAGDRQLVITFGFGLGGCVWDQRQGPFDDAR